MELLILPFQKSGIPYLLKRTTNDKLIRLKHLAVIFSKMKEVSHFGKDNTFVAKKFSFQAKIRILEMCNRH